MTQQEGWKQKVDLFRKRFGCREDVFTVKYTFQKTEYDADDTARENPRLEEVSTFSPQCMNYGDQKVCLIAQNKGGCTTCDHKKYQHLDDAWIWKHISGEKDLVLHLLTEEGIKFGACDFDYGSHFEDAKLVRNVSLSWGLPCYIARSSKKGYHLYWFFSKPVLAHLFTSLTHHIYDQVGFFQRYQENPALPPPEVFPKQVHFDPKKPGNGIRVPMTEPKMRTGFNCWVDDEAKPLPFPQQWDYFSNCQEVTPEQLEKVLTDRNLEIFNAPVNRSRRGSQLPRESGDSAPAIKPKGDFWRIVASCPALRQFWEKDKDGTYLFEKTASENGVPHNARVASLAFAVSTENGIDIIKDRWRGPRTEKEIEYALKSKQHPWTCKAMQDNGLCRIGIHPVKTDHCIKKIPPGEIRNGQYRINPDNLPESEWKDPSPVRFATGFMTCDQIVSGIDLLFADKENPPTDLDAKLRDFLTAAKKLDAADNKRVHDHISANKLMTKKDMEKLDKQVIRAIKEEAYEEEKEDVPHFSFGGQDFFIRNGGYVRGWIDAKGMPQMKQMTNFTVDIKEEITLIKSQDLDSHDDNRNVESRSIKAVINFKGERYPFKAAANDWIREANGFFALMVNRAGTSLMFETGDFNSVRNCIGGFSEKTKIIRKKVVDFGHYKIKGEHAYITPSVIVTKDYIRPNAEFELEFESDACKGLDFKIIDESQFKDLAHHILNDYFECNSSITTMALFGHAMSAAVASHIPLTKSPVLWVGGSHGNGKSFISEVAQYFYGNFHSLTGMKTSAVAKLMIANTFRDALFVMDDFKKSLNEYNAKQVMEFIQNAYDRSARTVATRNSSLKSDSQRVRGVVVINGEDYPTEEASVISRTIYVEAAKNRMNTEKGDSVKLRKADYCGFTPYLVQHVYNMTEEEVKRVYVEYLLHFEQKSAESGGKENNHRLSENLSFNMVGFRLAMDLLVDKGVIPKEKHAELCARHLKNLEICRENIISNTGSQRAAAVFLDALKDLLQDPARHHITNWGNYDPTEHRSSKPLGFWREKTPDVIYIYPNTAHGEVETHLNKQKSWSQSKHHIARQLREDGHIPSGMYDASSTSFTKNVKTPQGNRHYCWAIKLESLGFVKDKTPGPSGAAPQLEVVPSHKAVANIAANE